MRILVCAFLIIFISGCASVKDSYVFDGSSAESTRQGISEVNQNLNQRERQEFVVALLAIQLSEVKTAYEVVINPKLVSELNYGMLGEHIDGLNYYEILEYSESLPNQATITR
ncbi:hypothetical protein CWE13_03120 [Aliidiomarina shirensis]|uniref:Uncharacterized protein n=1 Tax=Aliidiomarina shirensis TaxID=1048642 RepID=A0A432WY02_9GAMM|nr:DUF6694 family lipoprotein [Aliidiomarina shirensis]RUO38652.1 hypothetical protein CWE13_03120 [Aliidiomarina shirensis]